MKTKPNLRESHAGGVVRVQAPAGAWGALPLALLEDARLDLDSRAVAAWLGTRPDGWQIAVGPLCRALDLGRDRWRRIARELEAAGYLSRSVAPTGQGGKMVWTIDFCSSPTMAGFSVAGQPGAASTSDGQGGDKNHMYLSHMEGEERTGPAAQPPVDKSKDDEAKPAAELLQIARELAFSKSQLGAVLVACKKRGCRLQDVYSTVRDALRAHELRGDKAVAYLLACLAENPGRDWTAKPRRDAQKADQQAHLDAEAAQIAEARALLEAAGAAGVSVSSHRSGKRVTLRPDPHGWGSGLVELLDSRGHRIGSAPVRDFVQALAPTAALKGRAAQ